MPSPDFHVKVLNLIPWLQVLALDNAQRDAEIIYSHKYLCPCLEMLSGFITLKYFGDMDG